MTTLATQLEVGRAVIAPLTDPPVELDLPVTPDRLRAIGDALERHDKAAERAACVAFDRAFPGLSKPAPLKPNLRRRGWRRG